MRKTSSYRLTHTFLPRIIDFGWNSSFLYLTDLIEDDGENAFCSQSVHNNAEMVSSYFF